MNECSVMSSRRAPVMNATSFLHNASFNMCGLNLRNDSKQRSYTQSGERGTRITGGFESSDYDGNNYFDQRSSGRRCVSGIQRSDSDKSDEVHLMNYDSTCDSADSKKNKYDLWEDYGSSSGDGISANKHLTEKASTLVRGRMYARRKNENQNKVGRHPSPENNVSEKCSKKLGAVPKRREVSCSAKEVSGSNAADYFIFPKHLKDRFLPIGNVSKTF